jgi:hypothetical protein
LTRHLRRCRPASQRLANARGSQEICYRWIIDDCRQRFGVGFHQSALQQLADLGYLHPGGLVHGGNRRYYHLVNPPLVVQLLDRWGLNQAPAATP